jgi:hypothetical protein
MAMAHTKVQLKTLSVLRGILRHVRQDLDVRPIATTVDGVVAGKKDVSEFSSYIMQQYRAGQQLADRSKAKQARAYAADVLTYLQAQRDHRRLLAEYRGVDPDKPTQREAVARFVGLQVPESVPVGRDPVEVVTKYSSSLAKAVDVSQFTGVDNLKAQYYGAASVIAEKATGKELTEALHNATAAAAASGAATPAAGGKKGAQ